MKNIAKLPDNLSKFPQFLQDATLLALKMKHTHNLWFMQFMRAYHWQCLHITFDFSPLFAPCAGTASKRAHELISRWWKLGVCSSDLLAVGWLVCLTLLKGFGGLLWYALRSVSTQCVWNSLGVFVVCVCLGVCVTLCQWVLPISPLPLPGLPQYNLPTQPKASLCAPQGVKSAYFLSFKTTQCCPIISFLWLSRFRVCLFIVKFYGKDFILLLLSCFWIWTEDKSLLWIAQISLKWRIVELNESVYSLERFFHAKNHRQQVPLWLPRFQNCLSCAFAIWLHPHLMRFLAIQTDSPATCLLCQSTIVIEWRYNLFRGLQTLFHVQFLTKISHPQFHSGVHWPI